MKSHEEGGSDWQGLDPVLFMPWLLGGSKMNA